MQYPDYFYFLFINNLIEYYMISCSKPEQVTFYFFIFFS